MWQQLGAAGTAHDESWKLWSTEAQAEQLAAGHPVFAELTAA